MIIIGPGLDAHNGTLGEILEELELRTVAEAGDTEGAGLVAELDREIGAIVLGGLGGDVADHQHARKRESGAMFERLHVADDHQGKRVSHAGIDSQTRERWET